MSNLTKASHLAKLVIDATPVLGHYLVVYKSSSQGLQLRACLQPGQRFARSLFESPESLCAYVVPEFQVRHRFECIGKGESSEVIPLGLQFQVTNPIALLENLDADPLLQIQDEMDTILFDILRMKSASVIGSSWGVSGQPLGVDADKISSLILRHIRLFAEKYGIEINRLALLDAVLGDSDGEHLVTENLSREEPVKKRIFISHAWEDKDFVRPLAAKLFSSGLSVWYDEFILTLGDSLNRRITEGLRNCDLGVVVISPNFVKKEWPQRELDGLFARELDGRKVILPVWHSISYPEVRRYSPILADRVAVNSSCGIERVVEEIMRAAKS